MLPAIYQKELEVYDLAETCTQMFIEALLIIDKTRKLPRCHLVAELINKLWYVRKWNIIQQ